MQDTPNTILYFAKRFFSGTMLSRISGLGRDIALAFAFGTDAALAGFLVAFRFAHLLRRLLGEGAFQTAFTPTFESLRHDSSKRAGRFFIDLYAGLTILLLFIILLGIGGGGLLLWTGNLNSSNDRILSLMLLMLPSLLFICLFGLNASLLQCERVYFLPAMAPTVFNLCWIAGALSLRGTPTVTAMPWMAIFINIACFSQWLITVPMTWQLVKVFSIESFWKNLNPFAADVRQLCRPLFLGMIGVGASQINNALDAVFALYADAEGPAFLWYAVRIQQLPLALIGIAFSGALLPALSRAVSSCDNEKYRQLLNSTTWRCFLLMLPLTIGMFVFGNFGIELLYARGDFGESSVLETTRCLWGYALGLIPMALVLILAPGFYARGDFATPMRASVASMILNICLNGWFVLGMGYGAPAIAIATSLSAWFNFLWLARTLRNYVLMKSTPTERSSIIPKNIFPPATR